MTYNPRHESCEDHSELENKLPCCVKNLIMWSKGTFVQSKSRNIVFPLTVFKRDKKCETRNSKENMKLKENKRDLSHAL